MLVFGTRPEAIKMAPLVKEFQKHAEAFRTLVCVTGQHREMLDQVLRIFGIRPDFDLDIMKQGQDLTDVTSRVLLGMRRVLAEARPDAVLVHGDTTTSTAAALAAFYARVPVGHVEAGLRTHDIYSPWPEEMNRRLTGRIATWHFAPTPLSRDNLLAESVPAGSIAVTGNTVIDALHSVTERIGSDRELAGALAAELHAAGYDTARLDATGRRLVLVTGHRRENFGEGFLNICNALRDLAQPANMFFIEPLEYLSFVCLMERAHIVLTDSGGIQEEAPGLGKPVLVMRDTTERPEAVEAGTVRLVGTDYEKITTSAARLLDDPQAYAEMAHAANPYGDGRACPRIVEFLTRALAAAPATEGEEGK